MTADPDSAISDALLAYLRTLLHDSSLSYTSAPERISGGFDTAIYGFSLGRAVGEMAGPLILRVFRDGGGTQPQYETAVQDAVSTQGYPTPPVLLLCDDVSVLDGAFTIMPRVEGVTMLDRMFGLSAMRIPVELAKVQARLHALDPEPMRLAIEAAGLTGREGMTSESAWGNVIEGVHLDGLRDSYEWMAANRPPTSARVICHGDLHPLNVLMRGSDVTGVIDWPNARIDDPAWDVGAHDRTVQPRAP